MNFRLVVPVTPYLFTYGDGFKINKTWLCKLRKNNGLFSRIPKTVKYETETFSFLSWKDWALVPEKIKEYFCLETFKSKIRKWKPGSASLLWNMCNIMVFKKICIYAYLQQMHSFFISPCVMCIIIILFCY